MDIKVITRHAPSNYGSLLQSIATITTLERLGHKCEKQTLTTSRDGPVIR